MAGRTDTTQTIVATPVLGTTLELTPEDYGAASLPLDLSFSVTKQEPAPNAYVHLLLMETLAGPVLTWYALTPGAVTDFSLPALPPVAADAGAAGGFYYWQRLGMYSEGAVINQLNLDHLLRWQSRSADVSFFSLP